MLLVVVLMVVDVLLVLSVKVLVKKLQRLIDTHTTTGYNGFHAPRVGVKEP